MKKPHIRAVCEDYSLINYFIDDNWIGFTCVYSNGTFCKSVSLLYWLNNTENIKKYLKIGN